MIGELGERVFPHRALCTATGRCSDDDNLFDLQWPCRPCLRMKEEGELGRIDSTPSALRSRNQGVFNCGVPARAPSSPHDSALK